MPGEENGHGFIARLGVGHMLAVFILRQQQHRQQVTPVIARRYAFAELPAAVRFVEAGHAPGKVVVTVASE